MRSSANPDRRVRIYCAPVHRLVRQLRNKCAPYLLLLVSALPVQAWEFFPGTPCRLTHETSEVSVELTYDPTVPVYSISLTQPIAFAPAHIFSMQFQGRAPIGISTGQHQISNAGRTLTVVDSGFGNVLNGLQFNDRVTATLDDQNITIPLTGAYDPVAAFRECDVLPAA